jgi:hypothetical protein
MRTKLIAALRAAADEVEKNPDAYDWGLTTKCNCGIVAQHITGISANDLWKKLSTVGLWRSIIAENLNCRATGLPMDSVVTAMMEVGMSEQDFKDLEYLSNQKVLDALGIESMSNDEHCQYDDRESFIAYARKWAELLEKEEA